MTEIEYVMGLYRMWDEIMERFPYIFIDNCASGGRRIDLETNMRSIPMWRSDYNDNNVMRGDQVGDAPSAQPVQELLSCQGGAGDEPSCSGLRPCGFARRRPRRPGLCRCQVGSVGWTRARKGSPAREPPVGR